MKRGEIRWYTFRLPDKRRPVLVLNEHSADRSPGKTLRPDIAALGRELGID